MTEQRPIAGDAPIWQQIRDRLVADIAAGSYPAGGRLPGEHAMASRFGVNRHTVRRALAALAEDGLIFVRRGAGAVVTGKPVDYRLTATPRFGDNLRRAGRAPSRGVLRLETVQAGSDAAAQLAIPAGSPLVILETVGLADGQPVSVGENRFPADRLPGIAEALECSFADPDTASITRALERCGVASYARSATRVRATLPDAAVARHLMIPPGTPVLETVALDEAEIGPVNLATAWFAGTRVSLVVDTPRLTSPDGGHAAVPQD